MLRFDFKFEIPRFKVGDTVQRTVGYHKSGMTVGDRGVVDDICFKNGEVYISIKQYVGWHKESCFKKVSNNDVTAMSHKEIRKEFKIQNIKTQINELEKQLEEILNTPEELYIKYINGTEINAIYQGLLDMKFYRQNRKVICKIFDNDKIVGKGVAKAMEEDEFNLETGMNLSINRAMQDLCRRREKKIIKSTF